MNELTIKVNGQPRKAVLVMPVVCFTGWQQASRRYEHKHAPICAPELRRRGPVGSV